MVGFVILAAGEAGPPIGRAAALASSPTPLDDSGIFVLSFAGRPLGTEKFSIRSTADKIEAQAEIQLHVEQDGKTFDFKTSPKLVLNSQFQPLTYSWNQKGSQESHLEVDFRDSPTKSRYRTVAGEDDNRDFDLPRDVVVLDDNVIHHYELVVGRYRLTAGGKQTFKAFIPQEALPGSLSVEEAGREAVDIQGRTETLGHLVVSTELARIDLWVDDQQHLQRASIPAAQLEAVRKK